jgi:hypothetical protein
MPSESIKGHALLESRRSQTEKKAVLRECQHNNQSAWGKGWKKPVLWGDDERRGLDILKHMEYERIFSEKGPGLARDVEVACTEIE